MRNVVLFALMGLMVLGLGSCSEKVTVKKVEDYREIWEALNRDTYEMVMEFECDCVQGQFSPSRIIVEADTIVALRNPFTQEDLIDPVDSASVFEKYGWAYVTVDDLFDQIEDGITDEYYKVEVDFHEELGYPRETYLDIQEVFTDDHIRYTITAIDL